jgi:hypothetical protein
MLDPNPKDIAELARDRLSIGFSAVGSEFNASLSSPAPVAGRLSGGDMDHPVPVRDGSPIAQSLDTQSELGDASATSLEIRRLFAGMQVALDNSVVPQLSTLDKKSVSAFLEKFRAYQRKRGATPLIDCLTLEVLDMLPYVCRGVIVDWENPSEAVLLKMLAKLSNPISAVEAVEVLRKVSMPADQSPSVKNVHTYTSSFLKCLRELEDFKITPKIQVESYLSGLTSSVGFQDKCRIRGRLNSAPLNLDTIIRATLDEVETYLAALAYFPAGSQKSAGALSKSRPASDRPPNPSRDSSSSLKNSDPKSKSQPPKFIFKPEDRKCFNCGADHGIPDCPFAVDKSRVSKNKDAFAKWRASQHKSGVAAVQDAACSTNVTSLSGQVGPSGLRGRLLIDTGADECLISPTFLKKLRLLDDIPSRPVDKTFKLANQSLVSATELAIRLEVGLQVHGKFSCFVFDAFVLDIEVDVLISRNTALSNGLVSFHVDSPVSSFPSVDSIAHASVHSRDADPVPSALCNITHFFSPLPSDSDSDSDDELPDLIAVYDSDMDSEEDELPDLIAEYDSDDEPEDTLASARTVGTLGAESLSPSCPAVSNSYVPPSFRDHSKFPPLHVDLIPTPVSESEPSPEPSPGISSIYTISDAASPVMAAVPPSDAPVSSPWLVPLGDSVNAADVDRELHSVRDVFQTSFPSSTPGVPEFKISLKEGATLPRLAPRRLSPALEAIAREEVEALLALGVIRPSSSRYASPIVMVLYPDGKRRLCVDFRILNQATVPMVYPMRNIKALLARLAGRTWFAKFDLFKGYHQIPVASDTIPLLAFAVPWGLYEYVRMPFGPCNGCAVFQQTMDTVLGPLLFTICEIFVDDLVVFGDSLAELLTNCRLVLERLHRCNLRVRPNKCLIGVKSISYLGFEVSAAGLSITPERKAALANLQPPTSKKLLRSFLGFVNYFKDFVEGFATLCKPFFAAISSPEKFEWSASLDALFTSVKHKLVHANILFFVDYSIPMTLRTDASDLGIGGYLYQVVDGSIRHIQFISKAFDAVQCRWATIEQEAFAVYYCILAIAPHVMGHHFRVQTDHRNLLFLEKATAPKLIRWWLRLQEFDFVVEHIPGSTNVVADQLSRLLCCSGNVSRINSVSDSTAAALERQDFEVVVLDFHNDQVGHRGAHATFLLMTEVGVSFPNMRTIIRRVIGRCPLCQKLADVGQPRVGVSKSIIASEPFQTIALDSIGPLPEDHLENKYILVLVDSFSRFVHLYPTRDVSAASAVSCLSHVFGIYGLPQSILSDNGSQFANSLMSDLLSHLQVKHKFSVPYRSEGNGQVERVNREVMRHLRALIFSLRVPERWSVLLPRVQYTINASHHSSLGVSPLVFLFGDNVSNNRGFLVDYAPPVSSTVSEHMTGLLANERDLSAAVSKYQASLDAAHEKSSSSKPVQSFVIGELVLFAPKQASSKLVPKWQGPFVVLDHRERSYQIKHLKDLSKPRWVDTSMLKPFVRGNLSENDLKNIALVDDDLFFVEAIVEHTGSSIRSRCRFLVKWENFPHSENTWQSAKSLSGIKLFDDYCALHNLK